jgi:hypothetical protein
MPRVALPDSCSYAGYLDVFTLHMFKIHGFLASSSTNPSYHNFSYDIIDDFFIRRTFQDLVGYPRILGIVDFRPLRGRPCQTPCSYAWRSGCLYTSFDQDHDSVFFSSEHETSHVVCFNAQGLLYECVFDTLLFSSSYQPIEKPVSHHVINRSLFSLLLRTIISAILPATMLRYYS